MDKELELEDPETVRAVLLSVFDAVEARAGKHTAVLYTVSAVVEKLQDELYWHDGDEVDGSELVRVSAFIELLLEASK